MCIYVIYQARSLSIIRGSRARSSYWFLPWSSCSLRKSSLHTSFCYPRQRPHTRCSALRLHWPHPTGWSARPLICAASQNTKAPRLSCSTRTSSFAAIASASHHLTTWVRRDAVHSLQRDGYKWGGSSCVESGSMQAGMEPKKDWKDMEPWRFD